MIYIHVPFCQSRCIYCDFYSTTATGAMRQAYADALCREMKARRGYLPSPATKTVYFGGGTPSLLPAGLLERILRCVRQHFAVDPAAEVTIEANPDDVNPGWAREIKSLGFNRVSLGVQSFDDRTLALLNRRHTARQALDALRILHDAGLHNLSIDLIYGLPGQSPREFAADLRQAFRQPVTHLSAYALTVEEDTVLGQQVREGKLVPADEETCLQEYNDLMDAAGAHGFEHYEISNFALPGYASRHNSAYWDGTPYLGLGPGAHSFDGKSRRCNMPRLRDYVRSGGFPAFTEETLTREERFNEMILTSLRKREGLDTALLRRRFGDAWTDTLLLAAQRQIRAGTLRTDGDRRLALTRESIFTSDYVIRELFR